MPAANCLTALRLALSAEFGPASRYLEFESWKLTRAVRLHVHYTDERCDLWIVEQGITAPRLVHSVTRPDQVPEALRRVRDLAGLPNRAP